MYELDPFGRYHTCLPVEYEGTILRATCADVGNPVSEHFASCLQLIHHFKFDRVFGLKLPRPQPVL